ncbi:hypothetical protein D0T56_07575 [Dysgonomonas sp. 520]|nr:hypothetical protein [Dysgonomonas sp. 520]
MFLTASVFCLAQNKQNYSDDYYPAKQSNARTVNSQSGNNKGCNLKKNNYTEDCAQGKRAAQSTVAGMNYYIPDDYAPTQNTDNICCDMHYPNYADGCLNGKTSSKKATTQVRMSNYQPYSGTSLNAKQPSKQEYSATPKKATGAPSKDNWGEYVVVRSAFGYSACTKQPNEECSTCQKSIPHQEPQTYTNPNYNNLSTPVQKTYKLNEQETTVVEPVRISLKQNQPQPQPQQTQAEVQTKTKIYSYGELAAPSNTDGSAVQSYSEETVVSQTAKTDSPEIKGFWGINFGQSREDVLDHLIATQRVRWNDIESSNPSAINFGKITFSEVNYDKATLFFKNGVMNSGYFTKSYPVGQTPISDFYNIKDKLTSGYGQPMIKRDSSSTKYYWNDTNNSRTIKLEVKNTSQNSGLELYFLDFALSGSEIPIASK